MNRFAMLGGALLLSTPAWGASIKASSEAVDADGSRHGASAAADGLLSTGWAEGEKGDGDGAWLELRLDGTMDVSSVSLWPGNLVKGKRSLKEFGRPRTVVVKLFGGDEVEKEVRIVDPAETGPARIDIPIEGKANRVRVTVIDAYGGFLYNDTYIAEVAVNLAAGAAPRSVQQVLDWYGTDAGADAAAKNKEEVVALFERITTEEFGDSDAMREIMDRAGDGAPYARTRVAKLVPVGFRVNALPPDETSVQALLKLKDPNAIPAIEFAAMRTTGAQRKELLARAQMFHAYEDLVGGGNPNIPMWGASGWEKGALRSLGEPMGVDIDQFGGVWVADIANHRVQRFGARGNVELVIGGEPDITSEWFDGHRTWYSTGSKPESETGRFHTPVDLVVIPGRDSDDVAVLDSTGTVQIFDAAGTVLQRWRISTDGPISPEVGGEGHLLYLKKKLVIIWGNEGHVRGLDGEEFARFDIEDGASRGAVALNDGKVGLLFHDSLVSYTVDGFRHASLLGDELGGGFESWDAALDEKGKLWIVTDSGWAYKYKRPGQLDYKVQVAKYSLETPRFAVQDGMLFIVERDRVLRVDALEVKAQADLAAESVE